MFILKKKKKFTLKKIKKAFKNLWGNIVAIPLKIKIVIGIWVGVLLLIIILILVGNSNKKFLEEYEVIEKSMNEAALKYAKDKELYGLNSEPIKVPMEVLISDYELDDSKIKNHGCDGFSLVYYDVTNEEHVISSYLSCKEYITKGYDKNK